MFIAGFPKRASALSSERLPPESRGLTRLAPALPAPITRPCGHKGWLPAAQLEGKGTADVEVTAALCWRARPRVEARASVPPPSFLEMVPTATSAEVILVPPPHPAASFLFATSSISSREKCRILILQTGPQFLSELPRVLERKPLALVTRL